MHLNKLSKYIFINIHVYVLYNKLKLELSQDVGKIFKKFFYIDSTLYTHTYILYANRIGKFIHTTFSEHETCGFTFSLQTLANGQIMHYYLVHAVSFRRRKLSLDGLISSSIALLILHRGNFALRTYGIVSNASGLVSQRRYFLSSLDRFMEDQMHYINMFIIFSFQFSCMKDIRSSEQYQYNIFPETYPILFYSTEYRWRIFL